MDIRSKFDYTLHLSSEATLPLHIQDAMWQYLYAGFLPGGFLTALLKRDAWAAAFLADSVNQHEIVKIIRWMNIYLPQECYGPVENIQNWIQLSISDRWTILERCNLAPTLIDILKDEK